MNARSESFLIIDDDQAFREVLAESLTRRGYHVVTAANGAQALAEARHARPRNVVLDLRLGNDSGLQLIAPLREIDDTMRIVVLTGYASIATAVEAIKLGAVHYLTKPTDAEEVFAAFSGSMASGEIGVRVEPTPLQHLEWEHIQRTLIGCNGNVSDAARRLGLHRRTLQRKLRKRPTGL